VGGVPYRHIGCCIDDSPAAALALEHARGLWSPGRTHLSLVHVAPRALLVDAVEGGTRVSPRDLNATERAWLGARAAEIPGAAAVLLEGVTGPEICRWAAAAGVDLLVSARHHGGWDRATQGSVTRHLVDHAPCAVLVVRQEAHP
jgi:nucleotide-binding universal stress UspA family protein